MILGEGAEGGEELVPGGGFEDDLPGVAAAGAFVEGGHGRRDGERGVFREKSVGGLDFFQGGLFGFIGDGEFGEVGEGWEVAGAAALQLVGGEAGEVGGDGGFDDGVVGLVGLENDTGGGEVAAPDAADDLGEKFEPTFFGREVGQGQPCVGLDDADGREEREVEAARQGLRTDKQINFAGFDRSVEVREAFGTPIVAIEAG